MSQPWFRVDFVVGQIDLGWEGVGGSGVGLWGWGGWWKKVDFFVLGPIFPLKILGFGLAWLGCGNMKIRWGLGWVAGEKICFFFFEEFSLGLWNVSKLDAI